VDEIERHPDHFARRFRDNHHTKGNPAESKLKLKIQ